MWKGKLLCNFEFWIKKEIMPLRWSLGRILKHGLYYKHVVPTELENEMKRWRLILIMVIVLIGGGFARHRALNREPRYQGRSLSQWLMMQFYPTSGMDAFVSSPRVAIKQIGTNAIPFLLKRIVAQDTDVQQRLKSWLSKQSLIDFHFTRLEVERYSSIEGFAILGKDAISAAPALVQLTEHRDAGVRDAALQSLSYVNPSRETLLPILLQALRDPDVRVREAAVFHLCRMYPEEARKAGVFREFPAFAGRHVYTPICW